jgi:hypothetical protein
MPESLIFVSTISSRTIPSTFRTTYTRLTSRAYMTGSALAHIPALVRRAVSMSPWWLGKWVLWCAEDVD